jgi:phosphocarrier protein HPr
LRFGIIAKMSSGKKIFRRMRVRNSLGLHTRPAMTIVKLLQGKKANVLFTYKKETINARSIMSLLMLAATKNSLITVCAEGEDAEEVMKLLVQSFANAFGEAR